MVRKELDTFLPVRSKNQVSKVTAEERALSALFTLGKSPQQARPLEKAETRLEG